MANRFERPMFSERWSFMRTVIPVILVVLSTACTTDARNISLEIPFDVLSTDELQIPTPGLPCFFAPVTQPSGFFKNNGFVDLDPNVNATPGYTLGLQVENYLDVTVLTDSNGNPLSGPQRNDFHVNQVVVQYLPQQSLFTGVPNSGLIITSGDVRAGGLQNASVIVFNALTSQAVQALTASLQRAKSAQNPFPAGDVVLEVEIQGNLGSGEPASTGVFDFPLHVCLDCYGVDPTSCTGNQTATPVNHGPCCTTQDFSDTCTPCGSINLPCCGEAQSCGPGLSCQTLTTPPIGVEACGYPANQAVANSCQTKQ